MRILPIILFLLFTAIPVHASKCEDNFLTARKYFSKALTLINNEEYGKAYYPARSAISYFQKAERYCDSRNAQSARKQRQSLQEVLPELKVQAEMDTADRFAAEGYKLQRSKKYAQSAKAFDEAAKHFAKVLEDLDEKETRRRGLMKARMTNAQLEALKSRKWMEDN
ncbi:hypothetical protein [Maridesulfovibrio sp.]|uniref:hypothetical protein n=1 Tax=Maridesulfovibrio sp. TaxID=2795000 RepID=UPI002A18AE9B|nr:hypothetical protein [Maridesulfovibrio sp.]